MTVVAVFLLAATTFLLLFGTAISTRIRACKEQP